MLDPSSNASSIDPGISLNGQLIKLPTTDSRDWQANVKVRVCVSVCRGYCSVLLLHHLALELCSNSGSSSCNITAWRGLQDEQL